MGSLGSLYLLVKLGYALQAGRQLLPLLLRQLDTLAGGVQLYRRACDRLA